MEGYVLHYCKPISRQMNPYFSLSTHKWWSKFSSFLKKNWKVCNNYRLSKEKKKIAANPGAEEKKQESFPYCRSTSGKGQELPWITFLSLGCTVPSLTLWRWTSAWIGATSPNSRGAAQNDLAQHLCVLFLAHLCAHKAVYVHCD